MGVPSVVRDPERLAAVRRLRLLDAPGKASFDRLTQLAAELLEAPIALLTLIDTDRQYFVSSAGLPEPLRSQRQTPLDYSLCQHAVALGRPLICADARQDAALREVKAVTELGVVAYAGVPLSSEGHLVGTLCVLDVGVRHWRPDQVEILQRLADIAADELRLHFLDVQAERRRQWTGAARTWPQDRW
jgi:GAF domain-containing protein